jgi:hypothetical protein
VKENAMSNNAEQHTPTPWKVDRFDHLLISNDPDAVICGVRGQHVTDFVKPADAYLIVRAVNAHDELLAACRAAKAAIESMWGAKCGGKNGALLKQLSIAIAKATAQPQPLRDDERAEVL